MATKNYHVPNLQIFPKLHLIQQMCQKLEACFQMLLLQGVPTIP